MKYLDTKTAYKMVKYPKESYAYNYCKSNGFILGGVYYLSKHNDNYVFIENAGLGIKFFEEYFKIDLRTINLEKLIK